MSTPSMVIDPLVGAYSRWSNANIVLLPQPDGPTIPVAVPAGIWKLTPFNTADERRNG